MIKTFNPTPEDLILVSLKYVFLIYFLNSLWNYCSLVVIEVYALRGHNLSHIQFISESLFSLLMLIFIAFLKT